MYSVIRVDFDKEEIEERCSNAPIDVAENIYRANMLSLASMEDINNIRLYIIPSSKVKSFIETLQDEFYKCRIFKSFLGG